MDEASKVFKHFEKNLGSVPNYGDTVLFVDITRTQANNPNSGRYYGLVCLDNGEFCTVVRVWGETTNRLLHPATLIARCDDKFFVAFTTTLRPIQAQALRDWTNFSETRDGNRRTAANLNWAVALGLVQARYTDKMRHWELTDLGFACKRWLVKQAEAASAKEAPQGYRFTLLAEPRCVRVEHAQIMGWFYPSSDYRAAVNKNPAWLDHQEARQHAGRMLGEEWPRLEEPKAWTSESLSTVPEEYMTDGPWKAADKP
jgi:hypothetical protein